MSKDYLIPKEQLRDNTSTMAMNDQYGIQVYGLTEPKKAKELLPEPLELLSDDNPMFYAYIVNIRKPTFAPGYMEGGIGILAKYGELTGVYFLGLQLSGHGAMTGAFLGREASGLPKKLCEKIVVDRSDDMGHCYIERDGIRLIDVTLKMGAYNEEDFSQPQEGCSAEKPIETTGGCFLHKFNVANIAASGLKMIYYSGPTRFSSWEKATASVNLNSSHDDRWGALPMVKVLGAGWMVSDNWVTGLDEVYNYPEREIVPAVQTLFPGRWDRSLLGNNHQ